MRTLTVNDARSVIYSPIDEAAISYEPILITSKHGNAVLLSEEYWSSISETLHLLSVPGMRESIVKGMK